MQDDPHALHKIRTVAVHQMADDLEGAPGACAFARECPRFGQIAQKGIENNGSAREQRDCVRQVVLHLSPPFLVGFSLSFFPGDGQAQETITCAWTWSSWLWLSC